MTLSRISFSPLYNSTLGFDRFFDEVGRLLDNDVSKVNTSFPPHNILKMGDNIYIVELAVAGFGKDEINITIHDGDLIIKGEKKEKVDSSIYLHRGIGTRSFTKTITIADTVEVRGAAFQDGILRISLENVIPDHKKPRTIEIGTELKEYNPKLLNE